MRSYQLQTKLLRGGYCRGMGESCSEFRLSMLNLVELPQDHLCPLKLHCQVIYFITQNEVNYTGTL